MRSARWIGLSACVTLFGLPAFAEQKANSEAGHSLRWAERKLEKQLQPPDRTHVGWLYGVSSAEDAFGGIIRKYGGSARAYLGLGTCEQRLGEYAAAMRSFDQALRLAPASRSARNG